MCENVLQFMPTWHKATFHLTCGECHDLG
jgi:hypothetical protein